MENEPRKKREIGSKEKEVKMTATKKKPFKILYPGTSKFFSCIYLCRFIQPRKRRRRRRRRKKKRKPRPRFPGETVDITYLKIKFEITQSQS